jgi:uncharacterized protein YggT (Ycf19 family)
MDVGLVVERLVGSALTLYMLVILTRWVAPWLELDLHRGLWRWVPRLADPLISAVRNALARIVGPLGPVDWSPVAALMLVWFIRLVYPGY